MTTTDDFKPAQRAIKIQGGALYLQVKDRLIWARRDHPELSVETEVVRLDDKIAVFRAKVSYPRPESPDWSEVCGTGHGSETPQGFPPGFIEKAETIAIGRALAAIGYGTAAAFEEEPGSKIADAPVSQPSRPQPRDSTPAPARQAPVAQAGGITEPQQGFIRNLMRDHGVSDDSMHTMILVDYSADHLRDLTKAQASAFIELLQGLPLAEAQGIKQEIQTGHEHNQHPAPEEPEWMRSAAGNDRYTA